MSSFEKVKSHLYPILRSGAAGMSTGPKENKSRRSLKCPAPSAEHAEAIVGFRRPNKTALICLSEAISFHRA
jgi:hypothetical protein